MKKKGEYFADYDEETALWYVFNTELRPGHAFSSHASKAEAEECARLRNEPFLDD